LGGTFIAAFFIIFLTPFWFTVVCIVKFRFFEISFVETDLHKNRYEMGFWFHQKDIQKAIRTLISRCY